MSQQLQAAKKRMLYSPTKMSLAIEMVRNGAMSKRKAAATYGVPKSTLLDKLAGRSPEERVSPGPQTVLTAAEENVVSEYCILMASIGYPLSRKELLLEVKKILDIDGRKHPLRTIAQGRTGFTLLRSVTQS